MRGMKMGLAKGAVFIGALLGTASAFAAAGIAAADVAALAPEVTYRRDAVPPRIPALNTYLGYAVVVRNTDGNTINNVVFEGTLTVLDQGELASFDSTLSDPRCAVISKDLTSTPLKDTYTNTITVRCTIGQLKGLGQLNDSTGFSIFFNAPYVDPVPAIPALTERDHAAFSGIIITAEGADKGASPNDSVDSWPLPPPTSATYNPDLWCPKDPAIATDPTNLTTLQATAYPCVKILLGTPNATTVKSAVPKKEGSFFTFFTGDGGIPGLILQDRFTTTAKVPGQQLLTATIFESEIGSSTLGTCARFKDCPQTELQIKDTAGDVALFTSSSYLTVLLRIDSENILAGTRIGDVKIRYIADDNTVTESIGPCEVVNRVPVPNTTGVPCIAKRTHYKTRNTVGWDGQAWTLDLDDDFEFAVLNLKNGKMALY